MLFWVLEFINFHILRKQFFVEGKLRVGKPITMGGLRIEPGVISLAVCRLFGNISKYVIAIGCKHTIRLFCKCYVSFFFSF